MNFRTTLILMCLLIAVGIVVVLTQKHDTTATSDTTTSSSSEKVFALQQPDIAKVSFTDDTGQQIVLEKNDFKWSLTAPVKGPADDTAVTALLSAVTDAEAKGKVDPSSATGLDAPAHKVVLTTKQNQTVSFDIGTRSSTGEVVYIRRQGQTQADVVPVALADAFDKSLKEFRRAKLLDVGATEIKQLRVASTQPTLELQKQGDNWTMTRPTSEPADTYAISDLTSAAANLRAEEFVSDTGNDAAKYGLDQPVMTVDYNTSGPVLPPATAPSTASVPTTIKFGRFGDILKRDVYAQLSTQPGVFKVAATSMTAFHKSPLELRDKKLLTIDPTKVTRIEIKKEQAATTQPTTRPASTKTTTLAISQSEPKSAATGSVATTQPASTEPTTSPTTQDVATAVATTTEPAATSNLQNEPKFPATTSPATTSAATESSASTTTPPTSKWKIVSKDNAAADDSKVDALLKELSPLRVERYEAAKETAAAIDTFTLTLQLGDKAETLTLIDTGPTQPLRGEYNGLFFVASRDLIDQLDGDFDKSAAAPAMPRLSPMMPPGMQ